MNQIIELASELIKIDTVQKNESLVVNFVESFLSPLEFSTKRITIDREDLKKHPAYTNGDYSYTGRENGVFVLKGKNSKKRLLFNVHSDVVPAGDIEAWNFHPFQSQEASGKLFGRGAADTKGGLAALLVAVKELREDRWVPDYDLIIEVVADEEGGGNGTLACLVDGVKADAAIFIEPMGVKNLIIGHRGGLKFSLATGSKGTQIENRGKEGSIEAMATAVNIIREFAKEYAMIPPHPDYTAFDNPRPVYIGKFSGGSWCTSPALSCCLEGVIGWLPDDKEEEIKEQFKNHIREEFIGKNLPPPIINFPQHHIEPCKTNCRERIVHTAEKAISTVLKQDAIVSCANTGTDMWIRRIYGKTPCVILGPGGENCHMPDEFVWIEELEQSKLIFQNILQYW